MKTKIIFVCVLSVLISSVTFSQTLADRNDRRLTSEESLEYIVRDLQEISKSIKSLNSDIVKAYGKLTSSLGLSLTDNQQKLLVTFEILNRAEQRLANLQKFRIDLMEKQATLKYSLAQIENNLTEESLDRSISLLGTTDAKELRERRRDLLNSQKQDLNNLITELESNLSQTNTELQQTIRLVDQIRSRLFPAIYRELPKLEYENK